jgi:expansin (peptidoglycan-binding protein)
MRSKNADGLLCGKHIWVEVKNPATGKAVRAKVADTFENGNSKDLKLSQKAFAKIGAKDASVPVVWRIVYH